MLQILRRPDVVRATGLKKTRLDDLERQGKFPKRVRISERATGWRSDEVEEWIAARPRAAEVPDDTSSQLAECRANRRRNIARPKDVSAAVESSLASPDRAKSVARRRRESKRASRTVKRSKRT